MKLLRNCFYLGTHREETLSIGEFTFVMAIGGRLRDSGDLFAETMRPVLPAYVETFGGLPNDTRYLVVLHEDVKSDGGAFPGSYSMLLAGEVNEASRVIWGHGIAHELLHFWNGHTIRPASQEEWFKEGFTDYLTATHMHQTGLTDDGQFYRKLESFARRYTIAKRMMGGGSMQAAGAEKHSKYFLVYGGGATAAFTLDVRLRAATDNERGLVDLMKTMYDEFGRTGKGYTLDDIVRIATEISGEDQSAFFEDYVVGEEMLPIAAAFETIGLQFDTVMDECYISQRANATAGQRAMQESMFGR
jgi:predicted metalloprotease with PDZ domain